MNPFSAVRSMFSRSPKQETKRPGELAADDLPQHLRDVLRQLCDDLEKQTDDSYREECRGASKARHFWAGRQFLEWEKTGVWTSLDPVTGSPKDDDPNPPSRIVFNHWQARGLSNIAVLSENEPTLKWNAREPGSEGDEARAKVFQQAHQFYTTTNGGPRLLQSFRALRQWTDGAYFVRLRYVPDPERFGYRTMPILDQQEQQITPDVFRCAACGAETPTEESIGACPECLAPHDPQTLIPGQRTSVMMQTGTRKIPRGTVKPEVYGTLEVRHPLAGRSIRDWGWMSFSHEVEKADIRSRFPQLAETIGGKGDESIGAGGLWARNARVSLSTGGQSHAVPDLVTETIWYLRPRQFWAIDNEEDRAALIQAFPKGARITYADGMHLEATNRSMDDEWVSCLGLPEEGARALAVGQSSIPVQESVNKAYNMELQGGEFGLPITAFDNAFLDDEAIRQQRVAPGSAVTGKVPQGKSVSDMVAQVRVDGVSQSLVNLRRDLAGSVMDETSAAVPAVWGGDSGGAGETFRGYMAQQSAAKGKLSMPWQQMQIAYADEARIAIKLLREHHVEEELELSSGEKVQLADLQGDFEVYPEIQEDFPVSWTQRRATFMQLISGTVPPEVAMRFLTPENDESMLRYLGLSDLQIAGKAAREKQMKELELLLQGIPVPVGPMDDHPAEMTALQEWDQSDEGMKAKATNPAGHFMVTQHFLAHQMATAPPMPVMPGPGAPGEQPGALPFDPAQQPGPAQQGPEVIQ